MEDLTRQSFKDECDVNNIVRTYAETGMINHVPRKNPQYGDAPETSFFEAACITAEIASQTEEGLEISPEAQPEAEEGENMGQEDPSEAQEVPPSSDEMELDKQSIPL